jgi:hypothetical protein
MSELKFTVRYQRKIQPQPYENMTIGLEAEFLEKKDDPDTAFKFVRSKVEQWIDEALNP